jgi:hypothetical protein
MYRPDLSNLGGFALRYREETLHSNNFLVQ